METPEARASVGSATVERGTDRHGEPVATVSWSDLEPGEGYVARIHNTTAGGQAIELPMEVASQEDTAQLTIAELGAYERPAHPELIVEVLRDGRVVARTDGRDSTTTGNADKTPVRPATGANLRRIVPVATKSESFLTRISCNVTLAIAAAGTLARAGLRRRERASAES